MLIAGGQIVDGSGNVGFRGAIGVDGESVRILRGDISDVQAARVDLVVDGAARRVADGHDLPVLADQVCLSLAATADQGGVGDPQPHGGWPRW